VQLEVPVIPTTFYAAGINYPEHVTWAAQMRGQEPDLPKRADVGYRANNALVPHGHDIVVPADATEQLQYEGELVVVIGKECGPTSTGPVSETDALDYVFGYTIGNDVEYNVKDAIFSQVRHYISKMSQYLTIHPGDVLWMGTDGEQENMKDGDVCEIEINDIGVLRNPVQWEK
jgi:2-keto-4-pentenoate hydratase/2-oxohepta-3-ene-1,7-dioic acid hydratase in catechol pathway